MRPYGRATPHQIIYYATYLNCYWTYVRSKLTHYKSLPSQQNWQVIVRRCISVQFHDELTSAYLQRASKVPLTIHLLDSFSPVLEAMHPSGTKDLRAYPRTRFQKTEVEFQEKIFMVGRDGEQEGGPL